MLGRGAIGKPSWRSLRSTRPCVSARELKQRFAASVNCGYQTVAAS